MEVLVTGATGFIGRKLVERLFTQGYEVTVVTRNAEKAKEKLPFPLRFIEGDLSKAPLDPLKLVDAEAVINLAGENIAEGRWDAEEKEIIKSSRAKLSENLLDSVDIHKIKTFIQASAIGYYRDSEGNEWLDENTSQGSSFLAEVCGSWEAPARRVSDKTRTVIARIGVVLGFDGAIMGKMIPMFRLGMGGKASNGKQWMSWIHVDDLVDFFTQSLKDVSFEGVYNLTAPNPATNAEFTKALAKFTDRPAFMRVPKAALKFSMGEKSYLALSSQRFKTRLSETNFEFKYPRIDSAFSEICAYDAIEPHLAPRFHYRLKKSFYIEKSLEETFNFFRDPTNLIKVADPSMNIELIDITDQKLREGTTFTFKMKKNGLPVKIVSKVVFYEKNEQFLDVQMKGPFSCWHHRHLFFKRGDGTVAVDDLKYSFPMGIGGDLAGALFIKKDIENTFARRIQGIRRLLGAGE